MKYPPFTIIVGYRGSDRAIGKNGKLPWKIPKDMSFFYKLTRTTENDKKNIVIMGKNTFQSLNCNPLPGRINIVCTSMDMIDMPDLNIYFVKSLDEALLKFKNDENINKIFVIGGEQLYRHAILHDSCHEIIANEFYPCARKPSFNIDSIVCDAFFPEIDENKYELILDYNSIDSIASISPFEHTGIINEDISTNKIYENEQELFIKIRYKKYMQKLT